MNGKLVLIAALGLVASPALAKKDCEELKNEINETIAKKGAQAFTLKIVKTGDEQDLKVVGSCDGGAKKIVYKRDAGDKPKKG